MPYKPKTFSPLGDKHKKEARRLYDRQRSRIQEYRKWYNTERWKAVRKIVWNRNPLCVECQKLGVVREATDIDHIVPHRGDYDLFWDIDNLQGLCKSCHSSKTGRGE